MQSTLIRVSRIFLAVMFLFSGISKLLSMAFFDAMVAELFLGPNYYDFPSALFYTQLLSRILIAAELLLGAAILVDRWVKKITLPSLFGMLLLFTIHLFYEGLTSDKGFIEGNCGCFGDVLPMNNLESIIKNIVAMIAAGFVWLKYKKEDTLAVWVAPLILGAITFATLTFGIKKYQEITPSETLIPQTIVSDSLTQIAKTPLIDTLLENSGVHPKVVEPQIEPVNTQTQTITTPLGIISKLKALGSLSDGSEMVLNKGEVVVCLFSMTCGHCQDSYKELCEMSAFATLPKLYLINYGQEFEQQYFFNQAGNCKHPFIRTEDFTKFNRLLEGKGFPRIIVFKEGKIVKDWDVDTYSKQAFVEHFGIEETDKNAEDGLNLKKKDDSFGDFEKQPWE